MKLLIHVNDLTQVLYQLRVVRHRLFYRRITQPFKPRPSGTIKTCLSNRAARSHRWNSEISWFHGNENGIADFTWNSREIEKIRNTTDSQCTSIIIIVHSPNCILILGSIQCLSYGGGCRWTAGLVLNGIPQGSSTSRKNGDCAYIFDSVPLLVNLDYFHLVSDWMFSRTCIAADEESMNFAAFATKATPA